jgi:hypothetical protein
LKGFGMFIFLYFRFLNWGSELSHSLSLYIIKIGCFSELHKLCNNYFT